MKNTSQNFDLDELLSELNINMSDYQHYTDRKHPEYKADFPPRIDDKTILFSAADVRAYKGTL